MLTNHSIICFANDWFEDPTSKHHVIRILSEQNKVIWVNSISMRPPKVNTKDLSRIWKKIKEYFHGIIKINENLHVYTPLVLPFPKYNWVRVLNSWILAAHLFYYQKKFKFNDLAVITFLPNVNEIVKKLNPQKLIYYCVDDWSNFSYIDSNFILQEEKILIEKSNLVLTTSMKLYNDKKSGNSNTHYFSHGVDVNHFKAALNENTEIPGDIVDLKKPIIGFFGLIHNWIDLDLMAEVATEYPNINIVMIGEILVEFDKYKNISNIIFLGKKPYDTLPAYCKYFDLAVLPFKINELTLAVNPIKLREYMSAGLPVLSTSLPEVFHYKELIDIADGEEFVKKVPHILQNFTEKKRNLLISKMENETWESKVNKLSDLILQS